ncbi:MAG TPA: methyltransferase [Chitinophagaceae bacterium]|nr:methyltransferase [Chitinophagaceae bacterium]
MPNDYFQFKQFIVNQDKCGMKVCTDSCVFGAWMAAKIKYRFPKTILDIGTGTGLLSLMVAQKNGGLIHAIDINNDAVSQAKENFDLSPWSKQLQACGGDIKTWPATSKYDCIISNPPFFEDDFLPIEEGKKNSKHSNSLRLAELVAAVTDLLAADGFFGVLLPYERAEYFEKEAIKYLLFVNEQLRIRQSIEHDYFRTILILEKKQNPIIKSEISIRNNNNEYTPEFIALLKDYYLYL